MEEGLTVSSDDGENINTEIDELFHNLTRKDESHAARIRALEEELDKKKREVAAITAESEARESRFREQERRLKEIADRDNREAAEFYDRMLKEFGGREKELLSDVNNLKKELIAGTGENEKLKNEIQELQSRLSQALELCAEERNKGNEKDIFAQSARSALKDKEEETAKIWRILEETKAELLRERTRADAVAAETAGLREAKQSLETEAGRLSAALARAEQGFCDKAELLKKELREKERLAGELDIRLEAAEKRLNGALEEAASGERLLCGLRREHEETRDALGESERKVGELEQKIRVMASAVRPAGAEEKLGRQLEARDEINRNLTEKIKSLEEALSAAPGEYARSLKAAEDEKNALRLELKQKEEAAGAAQGRQRGLEKELAETAEKRRRAEARLDEAEADLREKGGELEILKDRLAALEHERENDRKIAVQARSAAEEMCALAEKSGNEQAAKLVAALKSEAARYAELLKKYEDLNLRMELLNEEKARAGEAEKGRYEALFLEMRRVSLLLKEKELELERTKEELNPLKAEYEALLESDRRLREKYAGELRAENAAFEDAKRDIRRRDEIIAGLAKSVAETRRQAEKIRAEKESLAASLKNEKTGMDRELRKALKEAGRLLREKERGLERMTGVLEKTRKEKAELVEKERGFRESLGSRPYRLLLKEAEERLRLKEKTLRGLQSRMELVSADFLALKRRNSQLAARSGEAPGDLAELLAGISHQVSNSISVIRSHAEFCLETPDSADMKESLNVIVRNIVALQKKIEDMLGFSKPLRLQLVATSLKTAVLEALDRVRKEKDFSGIKTDVSEQAGLAPLKADRVRLAAVLEQLFLNAFEAMPAGGALRVSVRAAEGGGAQVLEIADTGEGIDPKNLAMVFHPFFTTRPGKLGLGLALAKNIVKAHGGTIAVSSETGKGTTLTVSIPEPGAGKPEK